MRRPLIAIDGPAGSGKSTLARRLADALGVPYLNTGLMYRALALRALRDGVDVDDAPGLARLARELTFDLDSSLRPPELRIDGLAPGEDLRSLEVESIVSRVARHPEVRAELRREQQRLCEGGGVVEGRDIGTVVARDADVKLFVHAEEEERVARRLDERGPGDPKAGPSKIAQALSDRDALDAKTTPL
jgi:cytidylate kinase